MPLILNTPETERPKQFNWDSTNQNEVDEVNQKISELVKQGFTIQTYLLSGTALLIPPELKEHQFIFRILSENGDDRVVWDRTDLKQIEEAKQTFNDYIKKGYRAYRVKQLGGERGSRIDSFDELFEEVIMQKGQEALLVPSTMPG